MFSNTHSNGMSQFPFLVNNRSLVDHENEVCFSNPSKYGDVEIGNADDTQEHSGTMTSDEVADVIDTLALSQGP